MATKQELATICLANCKPSGDCLIWQGPVDDKGYGYIHEGAYRTRIHRLIKIYGKGYSGGQIRKLKKLRLVTDCPRELKTCIAHWRWTSPMTWESEAEVRGELERAGYL